MERFAIKIDKSVKSKLKNLCRLCGIDNPNQIDILNNEVLIVVDDDEDEVSLCHKIFECVGIQVMKNDRMPQRICTLCVDKINDFYEYRQMCVATNVQTRKLLNLPPEQAKKSTKKVSFTTTVDNIKTESIFGIEGDDTEVKVEKAEKLGKPGRKSKKSTATVTAANEESGFRELTQSEIEELERIKQDEKCDTKAGPASKIKNKKIKKGQIKPKSTPTATASANAVAVAPLLAPKELNQRERKREIDQKKIDKKRKTEKVLKPQPAKRVKKEPDVPCFVCDESFGTIVERNSHLNLKHSPTIAPFGCSSCTETFSSSVENTAHHEWHRMFKFTYKCVLCAVSFEKLATFQRHMTACTSLLNRLILTQNNIYCDSCHKEFVTQNLFDWHDCFIHNYANCPKCRRIFTKKTILFKHLFKCKESSPPAVIVSIPKTTGKAKKRTVTSQNIVKREPEAIIETNMDETNQSDDYDGGFMDTHFGDSDDDFGLNDSIIATTKSQTQPQPHTKVSRNISKKQTKKEPQKTFRTKRTGTASATTTLTHNGYSSISNLMQPLPQCSVKLEPLDMSQYMVSLPSNFDLVVTDQTNNVIDTAEPVTDEQMTEEPMEVEPNIPSEITAPMQSSINIIPTIPTIPPLTIRIKKETMHPGYGDTFDPLLARNIKQEKSDKTWELVKPHTSTANEEKINMSSSQKKSKNRENATKLYKKPALLAIKIKQERIEREIEEPYEESYPDYSVPQDSYIEPIPTQSLDCPLPIITQIHSVLDSNSIPTTETDEVNEHLNMLPNPFTMNLPSVSATSSSPNVTTFKPIRIKRERMSPPITSINPDSSEQEPDSTFIETDNARNDCARNENEGDETPTSTISHSANIFSEIIPGQSATDNSVSPGNSESLLNDAFDTLKNKEKHVPLQNDNTDGSKLSNPISLSNDVQGSEITLSVASAEVNESSNVMGSEDILKTACEDNTDRSVIDQPESMSNIDPELSPNGDLDTVENKEEPVSSPSDDIDALKLSNPVSLSSDVQGSEITLSVASAEVNEGSNVMGSEAERKTASENIPDQSVTDQPESMLNLDPELSPNGDLDTLENKEEPVTLPSDDIDALKLSNPVSLSNDVQGSEITLSVASAEVNEGSNVMGSEAVLKTASEDIPNQSVMNKSEYIYDNDEFDNSKQNNDPVSSPNNETDALKLSNPVSLDSDVQLSGTTLSTVSAEVTDTSNVESNEAVLISFPVPDQDSDGILDQIPKPVLDRAPDQFSKPFLDAVVDAVLHQASNPIIDSIESNPNEDGKMQQESNIDHGRNPKPDEIPQTSITELETTEKPVIDGQIRENIENLQNVDESMKCDTVEIDLEMNDNRPDDDERMDIMQNENSNISGLGDLNEEDCNMNFIDQLVNEAAGALEPQSTVTLPNNLTARIENSDCAAETNPKENNSQNFNEMEKMDTQQSVEPSTSFACLQNNMNCEETELNNVQSIQVTESELDNSTNMESPHEMNDDPNTFALSDIQNFDYNDMLPTDQNAEISENIPQLTDLIESFQHESSTEPHADSTHIDTENEHN